MEIKRTLTTIIITSALGIGLIHGLSKNNENRKIWTTIEGTEGRTYPTYPMKILIDRDRDGKPDVVQAYGHIRTVPVLLVERIPTQEEVNWYQLQK